MTHSPCLLEDRAVIMLSGSETQDFLQGLITNDVRQLRGGGALYAGLLTPQGKVLFDFILSEYGGAVLMDHWAPASEALLKRLTLYRLRAKVELQRKDDLAVIWFAQKPAAGESFEDPRMQALGYRAIVPRASIAGMPAGPGGYLAHRLRLGVPEAADFGSDRMFALDAGLEELHGVSFEKGCYVGQELTARMKHRGTARKRLLPVVSTTGTSLPPEGVEIRIGKQAVGEIISTYGDQGFGLIRLDRWREAGVGEGLAGEHSIAIQTPGWLHLDV